jgi:hypothetical protein
VSRKRDRTQYLDTRFVHAGEKVNRYLLAKIREDRESPLASPIAVTWAKPAIISLDDEMFSGAEVALSPTDAAAYARYVHLVAMSGVAPWTAEEWVTNTRGKADYAFRKWVKLSNVDKNDRDEMTGSAAPKLGEAKRNGWLIGHVKEQCGSVQSGTLPKKSKGEGSWTKDWHWTGPGDDTLISVRPETKSITGEGVSPLTSRVCRLCKQHLPAIRFAKKRNTIREVCKSCDSKRRVERRKRSN